MAVVAAGLLTLAVQGGQWWVSSDTPVDVDVGPISTWLCAGGECHKGGLDWAEGGLAWKRAGMATYVAGLLSALLLVTSAGAIAARRAPHVFARSGVIAVITASIAGGLFVALHPVDGDFALGRGAWCYGAGVVLGIAAQLAALRGPPAIVRS